MKRIAMMAVLGTLAALALALPAFDKLFESTYKVKPGSDLGKAKCMVCHTKKMGGKGMNEYGKDLQKLIVASGGKKLTLEILKKAEHLDSNGNKVKNIDEIKGDKLPGLKSE